MIFIILNVDRSARSEHAVHPTLGPWGVGGSAGPVAADLKGDFGRVQNPYITIDWSLESGDCLEASRGRRGGKRRVAKRFLIWVRSGFTHGRIAHFTGKIVSDRVGNRFSNRDSFLRRLDPFTGSLECLAALRW